MPYVRKTTRKNRKYNKNPRRTNRRAFKQAVVKVLRSYAEPKRTLEDYNAAEVDWTGRLHNFMQIAEGDGVGDRNGRMIQPKSISYNLSFENTEQNECNTVSVFFLLDRQQVGDAAPTPGEIVTNTGTARAGNCLMNLANRGRFKILKRHTFVLADKDSGSQIKLVKGYIKLPSYLKSRYNGSGTGDIERNGLYCLMITSGDPGLDAVLVTGSMRFWYTDI